MKAWQVTYQHFPNSETIITAATNGKAKYRAFVHLKDIDYDVPYTTIRCRRAPQFDTQDQEQKVLGWDNLNDRYGCLKETT